MNKEAIRHSSGRLFERGFYGGCLKGRKDAWAMGSLVRRGRCPEKKGREDSNRCLRKHKMQHEKRNDEKQQRETLRKKGEM